MNRDETPLGLCCSTAVATGMGLGQTNLHVNARPFTNWGLAAGAWAATTHPTGRLRVHGAARRPDARGIHVMKILETTPHLASGPGFHVQPLNLADSLLSHQDPQDRNPGDLSRDTAALDPVATSPGTRAPLRPARSPAPRLSRCFSWLLSQGSSHHMWPPGGPHNAWPRAICRARDGAVPSSQLSSSLHDYL